MKTFSVFVSFFALLLPDLSDAAPDFRVTDRTPGPTPFIDLVHLQVSDPANLSFMRFTVTPKPGSQTRPLSASYSSAYLQRRGYFNTQTGRLTAPVFGLYSNFINRVALAGKLSYGTSPRRTLQTQTAPYDGGSFPTPGSIPPRLPNTPLSYDYIFLKSYAANDNPVIIDSDAEIRCVGTAGTVSQNSILFDNAIYVASGTSLVRIEFDGTYRTVADYSSIGVVDFHHNFDYGRDGIIMDVDTTDWTESVNIEVDAFGNVLNTWSLGDIITAAMIAGGDDPSLFVAPAPD